jgi:hypothetical protein
MKLSRLLLIFCLVILVVLVGILPDMKSSAAEPQPSLFQIPKIESSNYCLSCHTTGDGRLVTATYWIGDINREINDPCPAMKELHQELYYTERILLAIDRAETNLPAWVDRSQVDARLSKNRQTYSRLLDMPVESLSAYVSEAQMLRYNLGKNYSQINQLISTAKQQRVLFFAGAVTLIVLLSLVWGLFNAQKMIRLTQGVGQRRSIGNFSGKALVLVILIFGLFALPVFRGASQEVTTVSAEEQALQAILDTATRSADTADNELARSWMLGTVGAAWNPKDPAKAQAILVEASQAATEAQHNAAPLWGESLAAMEAGAGNVANQDKALLISSRLDSSQSRAWPLRLIAEEWLIIDPAYAEQILETAQITAEGAYGIYRDLDLRGIAVTWARLDPGQGVLIATKISDPSLRSWAFREISAVSGDSSLLLDAAESARRVSDPVQRARALREVGVQADDEAYFQEAQKALEEADGAALAYALSDLSAASMDKDLAAQISKVYPAARAAAFYRLEEYETAWATVNEIEDPYEKSRAQATIAGEWGNADVVEQITVPELRDLALRNVSAKYRDLSLVNNIGLPYYRVQALTAMGDYEAAWEAANGLNEGYPLIALAIGWVSVDPQAALNVVEAMSREADKADALLTIAAATGDQEIFQRALGMALAARVRGDPLNPSRISLALADAFEGLDPNKVMAAMTQAYEAAQRITIKYR